MTATRSNPGAPGRTAHRAAISTAGAIAFSLLATTLTAAGCANVDTPYTYVVVDNNYPPYAPVPLVVYQAYWQAVPFTTPVPPSSSSGPLSTVPASDNTAWVVLAPGWDPSSSSSPTSFIVMQSRTGFAVHLNDTLHIPVDDADFEGNCATGSPLSQSQADFITQLFDTIARAQDIPPLFQGLHYDAATCTMTPVGDAGSE